MTYYVTIHALENGNHTVHRGDCERLPDMKNLKYLGDFVFSLSAFSEAEKHFKQTNGCTFCTRSHHTKE
jgi:hypothetical protein